MGQKVHPTGIRLGHTKDWNSHWYASSSNYSKFLIEDIKMRDYLNRALDHASISKIEINRPANNTHITIHTARPGVVIGTRGENIDALRQEISGMIGVPVQLNVEKIHKPDLDAKLVAKGVAQQLEKRIMFRRVMKRAVQNAMQEGAEGIKIMVSGRLNSADIARKEWYREGRVPLHTLRADIDYNTAEAKTASGMIGVKVWIFKGEVFEQHNLDETASQANAKRDAPRYVQAQIDRLAKNIPERVRALAVGTKHRVQIRIGSFNDTWINPTNCTPFPDELLPTDEDEHRLRIIFSEPYHIEAPLVTEVTIKSTGPSDVAMLEFEPRPGNPSFHARIIVAHRNRILQTAILTARVLAEGEQETSDDKITIEIEALVRPSLQGLSGRTRFDLALAFNHTIQGQPAVFSLADQHAVLKTMNQGITRSISAICDCISDVAKSNKVRYAKGLEGEDGVELLRDLAIEGRSLYDYLIHDQVLPILGKKLSGNEAKYVQIVSLSPDAYFPAEFIYEFGVPADRAKVCTASLKALKNNDYSHRCTREDHEDNNNQYVCPFGFWGLQRVVERHEYRPLEKGAANGEYVLQIEDPVVGRNVLEVAKGAIFAASSEIDKEETGASQALFDRLSRVFNVPIAFAAKWENWKKAVSDQGPCVLIALPHVKTEYKHGKPYYSLEIGGDFLKANLVDFNYVMRNREASPGPLVILLGCDTALPQAEMDSIVGRFRRAGAAVVVGTVASVLGSHASSVMEEIVREIVSLEVGKEEPFGRLLLSVRRRAMGRGILMAMCIGGFGDADWLIKG
jgi:small subunit ribosomal protein S3